MGRRHRGSYPWLLQRPTEDIHRILGLISKDLPVMSLISSGKLHDSGVKEASCLLTSDRLRHRLLM